MLDRLHLVNIDWFLIGLLLLNSIIGVVVIYSSSHYLPGNYFIKQMSWISVSIIILFVLLMIDYNFFISYALFFYSICIVFLGGILFFGKLIAGTKSWIKMPFFQIQPSEIMKIAIILMLARIFAEFKQSHLPWKTGILSGVVVFVPFLLVALQPDLGTALTYLPILMGVIILAGINKKILILLLICVLIFGFTGWKFIMTDYQKQSILTLLYPQEDPLGSGYHILQSKIAIGSGGLFGKGYKKGTQSQLKFLPARHTDFVFSVIGEEFGFVGVFFAILIYFLFLFRLFKSLFDSRDRVGVYIVFMVFMMIIGQFLINIMMTIGLFPVAGIPLPLLSYGGSSLLTNFMAVSLVLNIKMRRFVNV
jgi:rod shape determining protein RodA